MDRQMKKLRSKEVASVKVIYRNHIAEEAPWESKDIIHSKYPHLFETQGKYNGIWSTKYPKRGRMRRLKVLCDISFKFL